ncbi:MAG: hypothetical protein REI11_21640, partial [Patulibacter sp.]|nr:hypothetical protein [Patulibacter sp.]
DDPEIDTMRKRFDDEVYDSRIEEQIAGNFRVFADAEPDPALRRTRVKFDVELEMAAPGWTQDLRPEKLAGMTEAERTDAGLMGFGWRVEQTWRGEGGSASPGCSSPRPMRARSSCSSWSGSGVAEVRSTARPRSTTRRREPVGAGGAAGPAGTPGTGPC